MSDAEDPFALPSGKEWELPRINLKLALLEERMKNLAVEQDELKECLKEDYALKTSVDALDQKMAVPIKIVYAASTLILVAFVGAIVGLVLKGHGAG